MMIMKMKLREISVAVSLTSFLFLQIATTSNAQNFDYFYLVMQWPPAYCNQPRANCRTPIINNRFTIHGMWPQKNNGQSPQNCPGSVPDVRRSGRVDRATMSQLDTYWPNLQRSRSNSAFWTYEWNKHGTCSAWTLQRYFRTAVDRALNANVLQKLLNARIVPSNNRSYQVNDIRNAVGNNPVVNCNSVVRNRRRVNQIKEIWVCVHKDGSRIVSCPTQSPQFRNCGGGPNPAVFFAR